MFISIAVIVSGFLLLSYLYNYSNYSSQILSLDRLERKKMVYTKTNLRSYKINTNQVARELIEVYWNSIYNGVLQAAVIYNNYTASINCYQYLSQCIHMCKLSIKGDEIKTNKAYCHSTGSIVPISLKNLFITYANSLHITYFPISGKLEDVLYTLDNTGIYKSNQDIHVFTSNDFTPSTQVTSHLIYENEFTSNYAPNSFFQYDQPTLHKINQIKYKIIYFQLNSTEIEDVIEDVIEHKIMTTFPDINIEKKYDECCQQFVLSW